MKRILCDYELFPMVVRTGREADITVRPLGRHVAFSRNKTYRIDVLPTLKRKMVLVSEDSCLRSVPVAPDERGIITVHCTFPEEQAYFLFLYEDERLLERFCVYAVEDDLAARLPLRGDLHVHSNYSDGRQAPEIVAANYRERGYDFTAITDHHHYEGSLAAIRAYRDVPIDLCIVPGEEVHLPGNDIHIVNFGGRHSVNYLLRSRCTLAAKTGVDTKNDPPETWCALPGETMPPAMDDEAYFAQVRALMKGEDVPEGVDAFAYYSSVLICTKIREAGGLSIFAHPYWINFAHHVPEYMTDWLMRTKPFDAFEVLGGERYPEQNEFQTFHYVKALERGWRFPVVGCSDNHDVYAEPDGAVASTIVFAAANERGALIDAVRSGYSVAVEQIGPQERLVGDLRLVRYARFLLEGYFPLQKRLCFEEGRLMKAYVCGTEADAAQRLRTLHGQTDRLRARLLACGREGCRGIA